MRGCGCLYIPRITSIKTKETRGVFGIRPTSGKRIILDGDELVDLRNCDVGLSGEI